MHRVAIAQSVRSASAAKPRRVGSPRAAGPLVTSHMRIAIGIDLPVLSTPHAGLGFGGTPLALLALGEVTDVNGLPPMPTEAVARAVGIGTAWPQESLPPEG